VSRYTDWHKEVDEIADEVLTNQGATDEEAAAIGLKALRLLGHALVDVAESLDAIAREVSSVAARQDT